MKYGPEEFTDRTGGKIILRSPEITDAEALIRYMEKTAEESPYLLREPGEFHMTVEEEERFLQSQIDDPGGMMLSAFTEDGRHIGNGVIMPESTGLRTKHRCGMAIALYREFQGRGIGRIIMETLICEAKKLGYEQAELEVVSSNEKAIGLYTALGFVKYGVHPHNMKYPDGTYADCDYMVKKL